MYAHAVSLARWIRSVSVAFDKLRNVCNDNDRTMLALLVFEPGNRFVLSPEISISLCLCVLLCGMLVHASHESGFDMHGASANGESIPRLI